MTFGYSGDVEGATGLKQGAVYVLSNTAGDVCDAYGTDLTEDVSRVSVVALGKGQRQQMGGAAFAAWKTDAVQLKDFVHKYDNAVFGSMVREASLKGILGSDAKAYYKS